MHQNHDANSGQAFETFLRVLARGVVAGTPPQDLLAQAAQLGPLLLPAFAAENGGDLRKFRMLARDIIDHMPRPELRYAARRLPHPERNDRCDCGSGRKYKQCCALLEQGSPFQHLNLLPYVLDNLPRRRWSELADSAVNPPAVADVAQLMLRHGDSSAAVALLSPWFKASAAIPAAHEPLFDLLLDAYDLHRQPRKKRQLLEWALRHGDRVIRSAAHQRLACMASDQRDFAQAWEHFRQAQREASESPSLSHLEVTLLLAESKPEQARERARFWVARLSRMGAGEYPELIAFLREVATRGADALLHVVAKTDPIIGQLLAEFDAAPAPASCYRLLHGNDEEAGELTPDAELAKALRKWTTHFPQIHPDLTFLHVPDHDAWDQPAPWLDLLHRQPLLWQSLEVLDDLVLALDTIANQGIKPLRDRLLERAQTLLERILDQQRIGARPLSWMWHGNRPALRLIAQRIYDDADRPPGAATLARMEWMLALNPNDNHGLREDLLEARLHLHQYEQALALASLYPDDASADMIFGRVLALFALGRQEEAAAALSAGHAFLPRVAPMLLAARPRKPKLDPGFVQHGGADQAWLYRESYRGLWERQAGALEWLRAAIR